MKTNPLISIVIPVYNVKDYIRECIESVLDQTYTNLEVLIINDKTPDKSIEIIHDLASDRRINIINLPNNLGLSGARNEGLHRANGEYVVFVDSDDKIKPQYIENLYKKAKSANADIVRGSFRDFEGNVPDGWVADFEILPMSGRKALDKLLMEGVSFAVWTTMYRTQFLKQHSLEFTQGILLEDGDFTTRAYMAASIVASINDANYMYRIRPGSILTSNNAQRMSDSEEIVIKKFIKMYESSTDNVEKYQIKHSIYAFMRDWTRILTQNKVKIDLHKSGFNKASQLSNQIIKRKSVVERLKFYTKLTLIKLKY